MNLIKQIIIQILGALMGLALLIVPKFPMSSWIDCMWAFGVLYIGYASPVLLMTAVISNILNPKRVAPTKPFEGP